jgi:hypothetical protein
MRLRLRLAAKNLGVGWPDDDRVLTYAAERLGRPFTSLLQVDEALEAYCKREKLPLPPAGFWTWPQHVKLLAVVSQDSVFIHDSEQLAADIDGVRGRVSREVHRLRGRACWCEWGQHPIDEKATVVFVARFDTWDGGFYSIAEGPKHGGDRDVACEECFAAGIADRLVAERAAIAAGNRHKSWFGATDDQLRERLVIPNLLHDGTVRSGWSAPQANNRGRHGCDGCGRLVIYAGSSSGFTRVGWVLNTAAARYEERALGFICSERCRGRIRSAEKATEPDARDCVVCGRSFTPARRDARTCSNACRQAAYRDRHRLGVETAAGDDLPPPAA